MNISDPGPSSIQRRRTTRRVVQIGAACVGAVAAVGAILILRDDPPKSVSPIATVADTSSPAIVTSDAAATTAAASAPVATGPSVMDVAVDFTVDDVELQPVNFATSSIGFVGVTADDRLVVAGTDSVVFLDGTTGAETSRFTWPPNETRTVFGIGPDDVLYVNEQPDDQPNNLVAYAPAGDEYIEVARTPHTWGDVNPELDETGVALIGSDGAPFHLDYVDATGAPSGKTLVVPAVSFADSPLNVCDFTTSATHWRFSVAWPPNHFDDETFFACAGLDVRGNVPVITTIDYQTTGDPDTRIAILSGNGTVYRANGWSFSGGIGTRLYFTRDAGNGTLAIGTIDT